MASTPPFQFYPSEHLLFWCHECDRNKVDSRRPETGTFYLQFGHVMRRGKFTEEYEPVAWAVCSECDELEPVEAA